MPAVQDRARELELELLRVRREAEAARLDARAAELELLLRRLLREDASLPWEQATSVSDERTEPLNDFPVSPLPLPTKLPLAVPGPMAEAVNTANLHTEHPWSGRMQRLRARDDMHPGMPAPDAPLGNCPEWPLGSAANVSAQCDWVPRKPPLPSEPREPSQQRVDPPRVDLPRADSPGGDPPRGESPTAPIAVAHEAQAEQDCGAPAAMPSDAATPIAKARKRVGATSARISVAEPAKSIATPLPLPRVAGTDDVSKPRTKRVRPASWLVSMVAHCVILLVLGVMTLASATPKDQVALVASVSEPSEESIETFAIESAQPSESEPTMAEPVYEVSAVGNMVINDIPLDISAATIVMTSSELMDGSPSSSDRRMLKSISQDSASKMQFCGVDGGGNHFVYLVDSSGSMRDGFYSARSELLASIDQLQPHQRFYVVFFDEEPEYMRIHDPNVDEPASVMATPENKQRLRKWAMKVQMNPGKAPYEVLPFALGLRPDVIFLLSDGEFPSRIEDILKSQNRQDNLFGESGPICIVHTIRYHGVEGETGRKAEATMVKIAKENGGQYRHVPKPK